MDTRTSSRKKRPLDREPCPEASMDGQNSSDSNGSNGTRQTSPKKIKRGLKKEIIQKFNWKCNPHKIASIVNKFTPRQKQWVKEMGFESVLTMDESKLPRRLLLWLIKKVDCNTMSLILKNRRISIIDAVEDILKFPAGPLAVKMPPAGNPRDKAFINFDQFRSEKGGPQTLAEEEEILLNYKNEGDKDKFWLSFMEVVLCCYLAPTTSHTINRHYVFGALKDVTKIPQMNWCRFAVNYLIRDIKEIRTKTVKNINLQGCLHILIVMFIDLVKKSDLDVPAGTPRIKFVTNEMLEEVESCCRKRHRNEESVFENLLDDEKLGKFPLVDSSTEQERNETDTEVDYAPVIEEVVKRPKRKFEQTSSQQNCILMQLKCIDAKYAGERVKIVKNHELALRKKLQELESKRLKEVEGLFQHNASTSVSLPAEKIQKHFESGKNTPAPEINEHQSSRSENEDGACDNIIDDTSPIAGEVPSTTHTIVPPEPQNRPLSPLQETVDIAADACHMATVISQVEGVDLTDYQPGSEPNQQQLSATENTSATETSEFLDNHSQDRDSILQKSVPNAHSNNADQSLVQQDSAPLVQTTEVNRAVVSLAINENSDGTPAVETQLSVQDQSSAQDVHADNPHSIAEKSIVPSESHTVQEIQVSNVGEDLPLVTESRDSVLVVTESQNCHPVVSDPVNSLTVVSESQVPLQESSHPNPPVAVVASEPASIDLIKTNEQPSTLPANAIQEQPNSNQVVPDRHTSDADQIAVNDDPVRSSSSTEALTEATKKNDSIEVAIESNVPVVKLIEGDSQDISATDVQVSLKSHISQDEVTRKQSDKNLGKELPRMDTSSPVAQDESSQKILLADTVQEKSPATHGPPSAAHKTVSKIKIKFKGPKVSDSNILANESPQKKADNAKELEKKKTVSKEGSNGITKEEKKVTGSTVPVLEDNTTGRFPSAPTTKETATALFGMLQKGKTISMSPAKMTNIGSKTSSTPDNQEVLDVLIENEKQAEIVAGIASQQTPEVSCTPSQNAEAKEDSKQTKSTSSDDEDANGNDDYSEGSSEANEDEENPSSSPEKKSVKGKKSLRKEVVHIEDSNGSPSRDPLIRVPPLEDALPGGESFMYAGSVNRANRSRQQRYQRNEKASEAISELVMMNRISPSSELNKVYADNVLNSKFKCLRPKKTGDDGLIKVRIGPSSITEKEFVQALQPLGKICLNFMWTISNAIMRDWKSRSRVILDQAFIMQLLRPSTDCDHAALAKRLSKLKLVDIEQLYLPTCYNNHWIALVVNFTHNAFEIYDSKAEFKEGEKRYKSILNRMAYNLQTAYTKARRGDFPNIEELPRHYKSAGIQNNNKDCGYWVIRVLQCHNGKEIVGNSKITIDLFRKEICYVLLYHAYNDFNPRRENLAQLLEAASKSSS